MSFSSALARGLTAGLLLASTAPCGCALATTAATAAPSTAAPPIAAWSPPQDPSEEITPEELASIPEPVPPATARKASPPAVSSVPKASPATLEPRSDSLRTDTPPAAASVAPTLPRGPWVWRVQILATPDRALAERVAGEASERLGTLARVDTVARLHKVRLGGFATEAEAQILKWRAVEMGYPGAFRVKISVAGTDE